MLRRVIAAWTVGLGLSATGLVTPAMPAEQPEPATRADVERLADDIKDQTAAIRELIERLSGRHENHVYRSHEHVYRSHEHVYPSHEREHHYRSPYPRRITYTHHRYDPCCPPCPWW